MTKIKPLGPVAGDRVADLTKVKEAAAIGH
jgi:hypothetical protein